MKILLLLLAALGCIACGTSLVEPTHYVLTEIDKTLIPYKGDETLYFSSNKGKHDSVELRGYSSRMVSLQRFTLFPPDKTEVYDLSAVAYDDLQARRLAQADILSLTAGRETANFEMTFSFGGTTLFAFLPADSLLRMPRKVFPIGDTSYVDVVTITLDSAGHHNEYFADRVYWSLSEGLLGHDKEGDEWRLDSLLKS